ncbi:hypothetical protein A3A60_03675 [Candidatus Curtissbacteria bacterium RIFCSPLOWO2_01_FULL_42_26]|uniref:DNA 3'-5' helicase n=1 Tax=Candidatus Curtissbacteria bacterium RIFCSPLOWO2_01_FULL_42_26 TaxID=1797729 RepID=A0A1F5HVK8_9BACT|nr:MAG: hypothetical protein A3A60_03675 [Candidatus Curtissbacteria bacterium RIFCSPLOWO2_01_FULL_42_26]
MNLLSSLNPIQQEAVQKTDGPVLILAGAGSGKTRVLTYKVAYLISQGVDANAILAVTFTNKAANEMKMRIIRLIGKWDSRKVGTSKSVHHPTIPPSQLPFVGTFHAFCAKLLRIEGKYIGIPTGFLIYDDNDSLSLVKKIMKDADISAKNFRPSSILGAISSAKSELMDAHKYSQFARGYFAKTAAEVYEIYQKELTKIGACDFDDLLMKAVLLFEKVPEIREKYAKRFKYVLVDEYQDVNTAQYVLTKHLASMHGNLTVVGDASQAIYSFRGADFRNILNFEVDFPNARVFNLEQNYRSTQVILTAANSVISKNSSHPILNLWTKNAAGEKVTIYNATSEVDEANFIVERILGSTKKFGSFAVLYRTNAQSRVVEEAFLRTSIPYKIYGGIRFYERKEVKDIMAYLRLIANPLDDVARSRVEKLGKNRFKKFQEVAEKLQSSRHPGGSAATDRISKKTDSIAGFTLNKKRSFADAQDDIGEGLQKVNRRGKPSPIDLIDKILDVTEYLRLIDDGTEQGLMRVENVKELRSVAAGFENLVTFLENVALMEGMVTPEKSFEKEATNFVTLMTIHAAKGLEFDEVFIVGMEEGLFPHSRSMLDAEQIEEERRLAYVGMTRARQKLYLSYATQRLYFGTTSANLVSRFVVDIPEELIAAGI